MSPDATAAAGWLASFCAGVVMALGYMVATSWRVYQRDRYLGIAAIVAGAVVLLAIATRTVYA